MNKPIVKITGEVVRRWTEKNENGNIKVFIKLKVEHGQRFDIFLIKAKDVETIKPFEVGKSVTVDAEASGREVFSTKNNKMCYFVDFYLKNIEVAEVKKDNAESAPVQYDDVSEEMPF